MISRHTDHVDVPYEQTLTTGCIHGGTEALTPMPNICREPQSAQKLDVHLKRALESANMTFMKGSNVKTTVIPKIADILN